MLVNKDIINATSSSHGGKKRNHDETTSNDYDAYTLFEKAQARLNAARIELDLAQQNMDKRRLQLRAATGNYEADSLLSLCDGEGHVLAHVMKYLSMNEFKKCEEVCHTLKKQVDGCWDIFETRLLPHPSLRSASAENCKERVFRYLRASAFANIGAFGENINKHTFSWDDDEVINERAYPHCLGCRFPDMNLDHTTDEYDLFVRMSKTSNNELLAEGFTSMNDDHMSLAGFDFSKWPEILEISGLIEVRGPDFGWHEERGGDEMGLSEFSQLHNIMTDLTAVVVAVNKLTSEVSLVVANNDFGEEMDIDGSYGYCSPFGGHLCRSSHGSFDANEERQEFKLNFSRGRGALLLGTHFM